MKHGRNGRVISFQSRKHKNLTIAIESSVGKSTWRFLAGRIIEVNGGLSS